MLSLPMIKTCPSCNAASRSVGLSSIPSAALTLKGGARQACAAPSNLRQSMWQRLLQSSYRVSIGLDAQYQVQGKRALRPGAMQLAVSAFGVGRKGLGCTRLGGEVFPMGNTDGATNLSSCSQENVASILSVIGPEQNVELRQDFTALLTLI